MKRQLECNKLIAEFMRYSQNGKDDLLYIHHTEKEAFLDDAEYDSSLDWLMPVVEKIESFKYPDIFEYARIELRRHRYIELIYSFDGIVDYGNGTTTIQNIITKKGEKDIIVLYEAIVEFIKWYNSKSNRTN